jgi:hypothetical protein
MKAIILKSVLKKLPHPVLLRELHNGFYWKALQCKFIFLCDKDTVLENGSNSGQISLWNIEPSTIQQSVYSFSLLHLSSAYTMGL